jgi:hypothetical protein
MFRECERQATAIAAISPKISRRGGIFIKEYGRLMSLKINRESVEFKNVVFLPQLINYLRVPCQKELQKSCSYKKYFNNSDGRLRSLSREKTIFPLKNLMLNIIIFPCLIAVFFYVYQAVFSN